ncbi:MAG: hypothetical protein WCF80_05225, partial [Pseudolabrys sp.]
GSKARLLQQIPWTLLSQRDIVDRPVKEWLGAVRRKFHLPAGYCDSCIRDFLTGARSVSPPHV